MTFLLPITTKHKAEDAAKIRRAVRKFDSELLTHTDQLEVLLYLTDLARRIDEAFKPENLTQE
jgi:hypothetical protein